MKYLNLLFLIFISFSFEFKNPGFLRKLGEIEENTQSFDDGSDSVIVSNSVPQTNPEGNDTQIETTIPAIISNQTYSPTVEKSLIILIAIGKFFLPPKNTPKREVSFVVYYKSIIKTYILPIRMTVIVKVTYYYRLLRYLEEKDEIAECKRYTYDLDPDIKYNCSFPVEENADIGKVTSDGDFKFDGMDESIAPIVILSSKANQTLIQEGIQSAKGEDLIRTQYLLNNTELEENGLKFKLLGQMDKKFPDKHKVILMFDEKGNGNIKNATCNVNNVTDLIYELDCYTEKSINAHLNAVNGITDSPNPEKLIIYMKPGGDEFLNTGSNYMGLYNRGSSSGLSGGAIAGIVIACIIALICITIGVMICRKTNMGAPLQESALGVNNIPVQESSFGVYNNSTLNNIQTQYQESTLGGNKSNVTG